MNGAFLRVFLLLSLLGPLTSGYSQQPSGTKTQAPEKVDVTLNWSKVTHHSKTTATLQVVVNPMLRRGSPIHQQAFQAVKDLGCDYVRYVPWRPYPKLGVAELEPPQNGKTSWDFSLIDPMTEDFMNAQKGHSVMLNFSTIPQWMYKTEKPVSYPDDPDQVFWNYSHVTEPRDPTYRELADYYARLISWYTQGGFTDEFGKRHESGHHYKIDYWEVLNEIDGGHHLTPEGYTQLYDAVAGSIRRVDPTIKFVGLGLAQPRVEYLEYFLDSKNHKPGIPLDMISYHIYAYAPEDQPADSHHYTYWEQADRYLDVVGFAQGIRARLSPQTQTTANEVGTVLSAEFRQGEPGYVAEPIPQSYWNLSAATFAYLYAELAKWGVEAVGMSQLVGYPSQYPSVTMIDWNTGLPNARFWVLKLLRENFGPGDKLVETSSSQFTVYAQGFVTADGKRKTLLVNKRNRPFVVTLAGVEGGEVRYVDQTTGYQPPASATLSGGKLTLNGFAVAVVTHPK